MKFLGDLFFWRRKQIENNVFLAHFRQFFESFVDFDFQVRVVHTVVVFQPGFESFPFKICKSFGILVLLQSCNKSPENEPNRLMAKDWYVIFGHETFQEDVEDNLKVTKLNGKFFDGMIVEDLDQKIWNGFDEPINKNVFHGFVQNWPVFIKFLILSVMLVKDVPQNIVARMKLFNDRTGQDMNLKTMELTRIWDLAYIIVVDQRTELDETEKVLVGLFMNHDIIKFWDEGKVGNGWERIG